ncbi:MAG: hypothetical protein A2846_01030 [Candidatus Doudnabacteria bacterium RIFCSPHIGHO2_01_FULL_49_9]|uniref:Uncharacterized protein n=1 Tax=Candidatus Doudnabacteria bacterium RIFCSPHIGHO2_01_FULL_49_9 TaxID=1817827 RepID=A0A1F5P3P6_9BACT|nr:MAG: hypothetical protein A2846_01030 [Candidatus Doudnabacteria bacterium RIFCSPHIGHO2_01_FULL_49_9]
MADQGLLSYIKQNLKDGFSENEIRQAVLGAGWGARDVEEAFSAASVKPQPARPAQSMDILEKELSADQPAQKPGPLGRGAKVFGSILPVLILLPVLGIAGFWSYQRFFTGAEEQVNSAMITAEQTALEAATRDRFRLEHIESLQTALSNFYSTKQSYPVALEELAGANLLQTMPTDPATGENYLYAPLGEPPLDYSLTYIMETDYGTESKGLYTVNPGVLIHAADIKTKDQIVKGIIVKSLSPDLSVTDLSAQEFAAGDEVVLSVSFPSGLAQVFLVLGDMKLSDKREPFSFSFTAPQAPGEYKVRIYGFVINGSILYQTTNLVVRP